MEMILDPNSLADYRKFLAIKELPTCRIRGRKAWFPDEYADRIGVKQSRKKTLKYTPKEWLFDYQKAIAEHAIRKERFAVFAECGLGKTAIMLEFAQHAQQDLGKRKGVLIISPLMVIGQTLDECKRFYGDEIEIEQVRAADLNEWMAACGGKIGITNYEAIRPELKRGQVSALLLDESSLLKSHYGKWGTKIIELGKGMRWKLCLTGTPAPNDRIEYANHAVFLDAFPNVNAFLATYFVNRGQTSERWALKPHALHPFFRALSHWCVFLTNPATYGWKDNAESIPPIHVKIHDVPLTDEQIKVIGLRTGELFATDIGGITSRAAMGTISKGWYKGQEIASNKPSYIKMLVDSWPGESTIIWCKYNKEQEIMERTFPDAHSMSGATPHDVRMGMIDDFKAGRVKILISKPKILGFGLNLHIATRQVFSGLQDSYEEFHQSVKRSNRIGSTNPLHVHIPVTDVERPMIDTVLKKANRVQQDTEEQERLFRESSVDWRS